MVKQKKKQTPLQKEYAREERLLKRRVKSWEKTHRVLYTDIPTKPKRVTKQSVERLRNIKWENISEEKRKQYRTDYEEAYEEPQLPSTSYDDIYNPPSEYDYYNSDDFFEDNWWEDTPNEPVHEEQEFSAEIEELIEQIVSGGDVERGRDDVRQTLTNMLENSRTQMGDKEFYKFLKDADALSSLQQAANEAIFKYIKRGEDYESTINSLITDFATILNMNRPISDEQAFTLQAYGTIDFDYY